MKFTKKKAAIAYQLISFLSCVRPSFFGGCTSFLPFARLVVGFT